MKRQNMSEFYAELKLCKEVEERFSETFRESDIDIVKKYYLVKAESQSWFNAEIENYIESSDISFLCGRSIQNALACLNFLIEYKFFRHLKIRLMKIDENGICTADQADAVRTSLLLGLYDETFNTGIDLGEIISAVENLNSADFDGKPVKELVSAYQRVINAAAHKMDIEAIYEDV